MKQKLLISIISASSILSGCSSMHSSSPTGSQSMTQVKPAAASVASTAPPVDLTPATQNCATLKAQFQTQLPYQIANQIQWKATAIQNPLKPNTPQVSACQISLNTTGETILKMGLTSDFMTATLERIGWASPQPDPYAADSATGHQSSLTNANQQAFINYSFAPPAGACPNNQPIAACKVSKKKWVYQMKTWVVTN